MCRFARFAALALVCMLPLAETLTGCAHHPAEQVGVPIDERPRPPQPAAALPPAPVDSTPPVPPARPMTPSGEESMRGIAVRDTAAASNALKRCAGKHLLPEQESTFIATQKLITQAREALERGDVARARSVARNARQLVSSLDCP